MHRRYILTGAPGAGKTALIRHLEATGHDVVEEAATDVIALHRASGVDRPWERPTFIADIAALQEWREAAPMRSERRFSDRSVFCTVALAEWLGHPAPAGLLATADRLAGSGWFAQEVFFIDQLGFIENTAARQIGFEEATQFGALHEVVYRRYGFAVRHIGPGSIPDRADALLAAVA